MSDAFIQTTLKVFDVGVETGGILTPRVTLEPPNYDGIECLAIQGNTLFSGSRDCIIKKWSLDNHELLLISEFLNPYN
uniref:Uncharacterized protein n=1 Tax=Rhodnius prolixus TaxID=13249 RepID=T1IFC3_RHOPR